MSSIAHGGETRGTVTLLRRERLAGSDGLVEVPVISGNALRGRLRRCGEDLLRQVLAYDGQLPPAAAHFLRGGGALAKSSREPLSGARLAELRALIPHLAVFGGAGGGAIIDGALDVGKVIPHVVETNAITGAAAPTSAFDLVQLEQYTRHDDAGTHDVAAPSPEDAKSPGTGISQQMRFAVETFPAGTVFSSWVALRWPTPLELAYFTDVLAAYADSPKLGGRLGIGHGHVRLDLTPTPPIQVRDLPDWRAQARRSRTAILAALKDLT